MQRSDNNKKDNNARWHIFVLTALFVIIRSMKSGTEATAIAFIVLSLGIFALIFLGVKKKKGDAAAKKPAVRQHSDFAQPEAHCVVCENTGDDHFAHDREQRIKQLDEWLKNGIIDRKEYQVMKARYERDQ